MKRKVDETRRFVLADQRSSLASLGEGGFTNDWCKIKGPTTRWRTFTQCTFMLREGRQHFWGRKSSFSCIRVAVFTQLLAAEITTQHIFSGLVFKRFVTSSRPQCRPADLLICYKKNASSAILKLSKTAQVISNWQ